MKTIVFVLAFVSSIAAYGMTREEAQAYSAKKMREAMEHSANMQKEKERIIQEAREGDDTKKIDEANYEDQKIYEQDR